MSASDWLNSVPGVRAADQFIAADRRLFEDMIERVIAAHTTPSEPDCYDAGLLGDGGGGDIDWWQDYIRAELGRAHEFYADQFSTPSQRLDAATVERCAQVARELRAYRADQPDEEYITVSGGLVDDAIRALATEPHQHGGKA